MKSSTPRLVSLVVVLASTLSPLLGCGLHAHDAPEDHAAIRQAITSGCGVAVVGDTADGDYCGFVTVKNAGATTVSHWTVDADLPTGAHIDWIDGSVTFAQTGSHVQFVPTAARATLAPSSSFAFTFCNSDVAQLLAQSPVARSELCTDASTTTGSVVSTTPTSVAAATKTSMGKHVLTWYSFQDNTPVNSALSASGRKLVPYVSVALPFRYLKPWGGKLSYGDTLYVDFLAGRTMPNGSKHTGWVEIDDYCGDSGDDSYCFQSIGGTKYPNVDLYIGDFTASGMSHSTCSGPAGDGQQLTDVSRGSAGAGWVTDYGARAIGTGKCGNLSTAKSQQYGCWDYTPPASSASECASCRSSACASW